MVFAKLILVASAAVIALAAPARAQEDERDEVIVVLGEGLPETPAAPAYSTVFLDRDQIISSASGRIEDVLSTVAGFQQFRRSDSRSSNPSAQGVTLRALGGNAASRALVLLDEVPVADPFFGFIPLSAIAPERLASIAVTRGGGSGAFGSGALAGRIELVSADAATLGPASGQALLNYRGETELSATIAPRFERGFAVLAGRWDRGRGFFTTPEAERVPATARARFDAWSASGRVVRRVDEDLEVQLRALAFEDQRTLRFAGADSSSSGEDISARLVARGRWQLDALAYAQWRDFTNVVISSTRFTRVLDQKATPSQGRGAKIELRPPLGEAHALRLGVDYRRASGDLAEDAYSAFTGRRTEQRFAGGTNTNWGVFVENDWRASDRLVLTGAMRAERYRIADGYFRSVDAGTGAPIRDERYEARADWLLTYRAGALYRVGEALRLRAAAYRGARLPTLNELYRPFVVFPVVTQANAALRPERLDGYEAGADLTPGKGATISLTLFDNRLAGAIANVTLAPNLRQRRNLEAIEARGLELAASIERGAVRLDGTLAWTDARVIGTGSAAPLSGRRPPQTPKIAAGLTLAWRPAEGALFAATLRHSGARFESDQETDLLPAATTFDLFAQHALAGDVSLVARVENLLDASVVTRNDGGTRDLGAPRTVWLGLRYGF